MCDYLWCGTPFALLQVLLTTDHHDLDAETTVGNLTRRLLKPGVVEEKRGENFALMLDKRAEELKNAKESRKRARGMATRMNDAAKELRGRVPQTGTKNPEPSVSALKPGTPEDWLDCHP